MEGEDIPSLKKAEIQKEWKERAVSQISKDPYSYFLALQPSSGKDPAREGCGCVTP